MDYEEILNYVENIVEEIEIEDNRGMREREIEDYDFD